MNRSQELLSDIVVYNKYAKYLPELKRRETWEEIIDRYIAMLLKKYCTPLDLELFLRKDKLPAEYSELAWDIVDNSEYLYDKEVLPSMRALQFAGVAVEKNNARIYNCAYVPIDDYRSFSEIMFLLLGGTGCGFSVQNFHVEKLPMILQPTKSRKFLVGDSIEGWSDAIKALMKAYFGKTAYRPNFDLSDIRAKGSRLVTAGGKAPGPEPLRVCLTKIESLLREVPTGTQLTSLQCHDIVCYIADAVLAGGIRRAALISLFSHDDKDMLTCKAGNWWELNPQRGRANNSAVLLRNRANKEDFTKLWGFVKESGSGEPGIYWTNDINYGTNPCCEISLRPYQFCNLTELNAGTIGEEFPQIARGANEIYQQDFNDRAKVAAFFGTLQAGFTDFHYLRPIWKKNTEKDALIGVGITGICNGNILDLNLSEAAQVAVEENERVANLIGINKAARVTTIKPSGTTSCVLGTSSGIHAWHNKFYIRNMQCTIGDDLYNYFVENHPSLIKDMDYQTGSAVIGIPQEAPSDAVLRENESALQFLQRVERFNLEWVRKGHRKGPNYNNVSATCSVNNDVNYHEGQFGVITTSTKQSVEAMAEHYNTTVEEVRSGSGPTMSEWEMVGSWMWENKDKYNGLSVLPYDGGTYKDAPFMECTREEFEDKMKYIEENPIVLTDIIEEEDNTTQKDNLACSGNSCEIV